MYSYYFAASHVSFKISSPSFLRHFVPHFLFISWPFPLFHSFSHFFFPFFCLFLSFLIFHILSLTQSPQTVIFSFSPYFLLDNVFIKHLRRERKKLEKLFSFILRYSFYFMSFLHPRRITACPGEVIRAASVVWFGVPGTGMRHRVRDVEQWPTMAPTVSLS